MGKHFSKGKLCQMELTPGPKSGETARQREPSRMHPGPSQHLLARFGARGPRRRALGWPGKARFQLIYTFPCLTPGLQPPGTDSIIGTIFSPFSSYGSALGSPSFAFWEMSIQQDVVQTQRCEDLFWGYTASPWQGALRSPRAWGHHAPSTVCPLQPAARAPPPESCLSLAIPDHRDHPLSFKLLWHRCSLLLNIYFPFILHRLITCYYHWPTLFPRTCVLKEVLLFLTFPAIPLTMETHTHTRNVERIEIQLLASWNNAHLGDIRATHQPSAWGSLRMGSIFFFIFVP